MSVAERAAELKRLFMCGTGRRLDLSNPKTFDEKMQWLKLYGESDLRARLIDKVVAREWVAEKVREVRRANAQRSGDSFDEIDFDTLPDRFALKCNHGAGYNIIVHDKSNLDLADAKVKVDDDE